MEDLAPGIRFYPTEEELVSFYLHHKLEGKRDSLNRIMDRVIPVLDIYEFSPWQLPQFSGEYNHRDPEQWFFFIPRQESEVRGGRPKRLTTCGYWKATGSPGYVYSSDNRSIGVKRTMVFYKGRAPDGRKTDWKMNEYKAIQPDASSSSNPIHPQIRQEFSVCRLYKKSKCIRSFDRRPVGVKMGQQMAQRVHGDHHGIRENHQDISMAERRNPPDEMESSSSGDCGHVYHPYQIGEGSNMPMPTDDHDHLFDLDQLDNWCFGGEDM